MMGNSKEKYNDEATKNDFAENVVTTTQGNLVKKNSMGADGNKKELNDFNKFLEKLSNYENKKGYRK